jgi:LemA protein
MILGAIGAALVVLLVFLISWSIMAYNNFVRTDALAQEGWSGVDVQLKRRYDLIPNLVAVVKQYATHEKETLERVISMRSISAGATDINQIAKAEAGLTQALKTLFAVAESYPDLKANQNFLSLQKDLGDIEHEVQLARRYYNGAVRNYNVLVDVFPSNMIAKFASFQRRPYFEMEDGERQAPKVQF